MTKDDEKDRIIRDNIERLKEEAKKVDKKIEKDDKRFQNLLKKMDKEED